MSPNVADVVPTFRVFTMCTCLASDSVLPMLPRAQEVGGFTLSTSTYITREATTATIATTANRTGGSALRRSGSLESAPPLRMATARRTTSSEILAGLLGRRSAPAAVPIATVTWGPSVEVGCLGRTLRHPVFGSADAVIPDATSWLGRRLADGPARMADVATEAAAAGISKKALRDSLSSLGVQTRGGVIRLGGWDAGYWRRYKRFYDAELARTEAEIARIEKRAAREETHRCMVIIESPHAEDRYRLAMHLACKTDVPADQAIAYLRGAPAEGSFGLERW